MRALLTLVVGIILAVPCFGEDSFTDVPKDHWAKEAIDMVSQNGIMNGYPDSTFKGDKPVTRYELCVALAKMVEFIQASRKPIIENNKSEPAAHWADPSVETLKTNGLLPADSPLLKDGSKPVTTKELGDALAQVSAKLIEMTVSPAGAPD